jgi:hypothetical protein
MKRTIAELRDFNSTGKNDYLQSAVGRVSSSEEDAAKVRQSSRKRKPIVTLDPSVKKASLDKETNGKKQKLGTELKNGTKVEGRYGAGQVWYPGTIKKVRADGTFLIEYDDGDSEDKVSSDMIRPHVSDDGEPLKKGAKVEARFAQGKNWFEGVIKLARKDGTYDIHYADGDKEEKVGRDLIRKVHEEEESEKKLTVATGKAEEKSKKATVAKSQMPGKSGKSLHKPVVEAITSDDAESDDDNDCTTVEKEYWSRWAQEFGDGEEKDDSLEGCSWRKLGGLLAYKRAHAGEFGPKEAAVGGPMWMDDGTLEVTKHGTNGIGINGLTDLRKKVRTLLSKAMDSVLELSSYIKSKAYETECVYDIVAAHIEREMYRAVLRTADTTDQGVSFVAKQRIAGLVKEYRQRCRTLVSNLSDPKNPQLRQRVLGQELGVRELCAMSPLELASTSLQRLRKEIIQKKLVTEVLITGANTAHSKKLVQAAGGVVGPVGGENGEESCLCTTRVACVQLVLPLLR